LDIAHDRSLCGVVSKVATTHMIQESDFLRLPRHLTFTFTTARRDKTHMRIQSARRQPAVRPHRQRRRAEL
jgi:hypothetical protein